MLVLGVQYHWPALRGAWYYVLLVLHYRTPYPYGVLVREPVKVCAPGSSMGHPIRWHPEVLPRHPLPPSVSLMQLVVVLVVVVCSTYYWACITVPQ